YYDNPNPGTYSYSYTVSVERSAGCPSCSPLQSDKSAPASASLTTPKPKPSPTPTPAPTSTGGSTGGGGSTSGSTGGTTGGGSSTTTGGSTSGSSTGSGTSTGGSSNASTGVKTSSSPVPLPTLDPGIQKRAFALNFSNFSAGLGIPKLPPLPSTAITLPGREGAEPAGTYQPTLPYQKVTETTHSRSIVSNPIGSITSINTGQLAKCLAFALILIMCAAHLRRWVGAHVED
ncbi:MAG: hypothetical protein ABR549_09160, partial [Mycobacteriales bacterium]